MCILWENLISKAPFYYKMMFSKHYKKMFCENIYHICQHHYNSLNTNNIKTDRHAKNGKIYQSICQSICHTLPRNRNIIPPQPEHHSTATGTSFHRYRNIIPPQPEHHFSTTGTTFSRHKH